MRVRFVTPHLAKQLGGIENAVVGLRTALERVGVLVLQDCDLTQSDVVHHFHGLWEPSHSHLGRRLRHLGRPYVVSPHGMMEPWAFRHRRWKKIPYFWLFERRFLLGANALFVTSEMEARNVRTVLEHPSITVLPLGCRDSTGPSYDTARLSLNWSSQERVMLFLSRLHSKKGLELLFHSLAAAGANWGDWKLMIVGDGERSYVSKVKSLANRLAAALPQVEWISGVWGVDRWKYFQAADLFCLPTHSENFGLAVLESILVGTPVLTTDQTPWHDYTSVDGIFITQPNVASVRGGLLSAQRRLQNGWNSHDRMKLANWALSRFSWERLGPDYAAAYQRAMSVLPD